MGIAAVKHFMFGLGVALVCGSTATAEYAEYASWSCKASTAQYTIFSDKMVSVNPQGLVFNFTCKKGFCVTMRYDSEYQQDRVSIAQILYEISEDDANLLRPKELRHHFFKRLKDETIYIGRPNNMIETFEKCEKI